MAEVLITLGIIGVVAALTMPSLIANHKKIVYVNQLKKVYVTVQQGINMCRYAEGGVNFTDTSLYSLIKSDASIDDVTNEAGKYFSIIKSCKGDCDLECKALSGGKCQGPTIWTNSSDKYPIYNFFLKDGSVIGFISSSSHHEGVMDIVVDVNGKKKPNQYGRDIFRLAIEKNNLVVAWDDVGTGECYKISVEVEGCAYAKGKLSIGCCCAEQIITSGWKMDY